MSAIFKQQTVFFKLKRSYYLNFMDRPKIPLQNPLDLSETDDPRLVEELVQQNERSIEVEYSAWESQVAKLVGLEDKSLNSDSEEPKNSAREQLTPESEDEIEVAAKPALSANPFAKLGLVSLATLAIVLLVGIFLSQIMNVGQTKPSQNDVLPSEPPKQSTTESYMLELEEEVEHLKTKLALAKQADAVKVAQESLRQETPKPKETISENLTPSSKPEPPTAAVPPINQPQVVYLDPPAQQPAPPSPPKTEPAKPDPFEEWTRLAKLGSYGQVPVASESQIAQQPPKQNTKPDPQIAQQPPKQSIKPESQIARQPQTFLDDDDDDFTTRGSRRQKRNFVTVGSNAKAVLKTAVFGETTKSGNPNPQGETVFAVNLQEPLKGSNGEIALPVDTQLLVTIGSLSDRGLVKLKVDKVIVPEDNGNFAERSFPSNAFAIHSLGGKPLLAEKFPNQSGSIASKDAQMFLMGGLGKAAELYNRIDTEIIINDGSNTTVSSGDSQRNIPAGAVQGGIEALVPVLAQRNQQQISQMMQRTDVWLVPAGEEVELYVNREILL